MLSTTSKVAEAGVVTRLRVSRRPAEKIAVLTGAIVGRVKAIPSGAVSVRPSAASVAIVAVTALSLASQTRIRPPTR